jgi:hypothetical protein
MIEGATVCADEFAIDHGADRDRAARAAAVFDNDRLAEIGCNTVEHRARDDVGGAAGAERNENLDRLGRPILR